MPGRGDAPCEGSEGSERDLRERQEETDDNGKK